MVPYYTYVNFTDKPLTDDTTVESVFDSHPHIIGAMQSLLDVEGPGKNNWKDLADVFHVERNEAQDCTRSYKDNPAKGLLEYVNAKYPLETVGDLIKKLEECQLKAESKVLNNCKG